MPLQSSSSLERVGDLGAPFLFPYLYLAVVTNPVLLQCVQQQIALSNILRTFPYQLVLLLEIEFVYVMQLFLVIAIVLCPPQSGIVGSFCDGK